MSLGATNGAVASARYDDPEWLAQQAYANGVREGYARGRLAWGVVGFVLGLVAVLSAAAFIKR